MIQTPTTIHGDPEHNGLRVTIPIVLILAYLLVFILLMVGLPTIWGGRSSQYLVLSGCAALPFALGIMALVDLLLKRVWHSGRQISIDEDQIVYRQPDAPTAVFKRHVPIQVTRWYFRMDPFPRVGRERQIKNGWVCFACLVKQAENLMVAHTYVPPRRAAEHQAQATFHQIKMGKIYDMTLTTRVQQFRAPKGRPTIPPDLILSDSGPYWLGERQRWENGLELTPKDFMTLNQTLLVNEELTISN